MHVRQSFSIPTLSPPFERCYWVVEKLLLAGAYPGNTDKIAHINRITGLWESGIRTFVNLMEEGEKNNSGQAFVRYDDLLREKAASSNCRVAHLRFPIPDTKVTTPDRMQSILDAVDLSLENKVPVYVHCFGGMGRTGTVICCWLLRHGLANKDNVLNLLTTLRQADKQRASWPAPENDTQRQFVLDWPEFRSAGVTNVTSSVLKVESPQSHTRSRRNAMSGTNWFERLLGFTESGRDRVHKELGIAGNKLRSKKTDEEWICGELEIVSLADLRERLNRVNSNKGKCISVSELVGDAKALHADPANAGAMFQVASQFNLLEMVSPSVTPEQGIEIYENDPTQGPACAIACGAGTIYRNYFVPLDGQIGQTANKQVDCLADVGEALGNVDGRLWKMKNGYALPTAEGLREVDSNLGAMSESELDELRSMLKIGVQWDTQVTLSNSENRVSEHLLTQAYCSAMPVAYSGLSSGLWERFARLILEAAYEATLAAAVLNAAKSGNRSVYLTSLGGGAFGNDQAWILDAIRRAVKLYNKYDLDVRIVSFRHSNSAIRKLCKEVLGGDDDCRTG